MDLGKVILRFLREHSAVDKEVLIACSGGPDSVALAHAVSVLVHSGHLAGARLLHIDHGLRPDSSANAQAVAVFAQQLRLPITIERVTVSREGSLEAAARDARYQAFERVARAHGDAHVLTAHTASDQAETLFMRILRGTGLRGLGGIPAARGRYRRPLLICTRNEILKYVRMLKLPTITDSMNADERFLRVRARRRWLPALRSENPQLDAALCRLGEDAQRVDATVEFAGKTLLAQAVQRDQLRLAPLCSAPVLARRRALALWLAKRRIGPLSATHWGSLDRLMDPPHEGSQQLALPGGELHRDYEVLRAVATGDAASESGPVVVRGLVSPHRVRTWRHGDRMRPARLKGRSRKLSDSFVDAKVARSERAVARVVETEAGEIVWAEHIGLAHQADCEVNLTHASSIVTNKG